MQLNESTLGLERTLMVQPFYLYQVVWRSARTEQPELVSTAADQVMPQESARLPHARAIITLWLQTDFEPLSLPSKSLPSSWLFALLVFKYIISFFLASSLKAVPLPGALSSACSPDKY